MRLRLVIYLQNGSEVSGLYAWPEALKHLVFAAKQPDFKDFKWEAIYE